MRGIFRFKATTSNGASGKIKISLSRKKKDSELPWSYTTVSAKP